MVSNGETSAGAQVGRKASQKAKSRPQTPKGLTAHEQPA